jgi:hypothetical protein
VKQTVCNVSSEFKLLKPEEKARDNAKHGGEREEVKCRGGSEREERYY